MGKVSKSEAEKIRGVLRDAEVSDKRIKALEATIENVAWMKEKLEEARDEIGDESMVIPYDNGGNQKGIRENPLYKAYESLWKSYMNGMERILDCLPKEEIAQNTSVVETSKTKLELIRNKHKKEA